MAKEKHIENLMDSSLIRIIEQVSDKMAKRESKAGTKRAGTVHISIIAVAIAGWNLVKPYLDKIDEIYRSQKSIVFQEPFRVWMKDSQANSPGWNPVPFIPGTNGQTSSNQNEKRDSDSIAWLPPKPSDYADQVAQ